MLELLRGNMDHNINDIMDHNINVKSDRSIIISMSSLIGLRDKNMERRRLILYCTHLQKEGTSTSQEGSLWENIFTPNRVGTCVTHPKGLRHGRKMSHASQPLLQSLLSEQPDFRIQVFFLS